MDKTTKTKTKTETKTKTKTMTKTKTQRKQLNHYQCAIFLKMLGRKGVKYYILMITKKTKTQTNTKTKTKTKTFIIFKEQPKRLLTFETFNQSDEET